MQRILVTGASGFIGNAVVQHLLHKGHNVRALVRSQNTLSLKCEKVIGTMQDSISLDAACKDIDWVIHLAARKADETDSYDTNVEGAKRLVHACQKNNVSRIINISTQSARLKRSGIYGETKKQAEKVFIESNIPVITLRASLVYGDLHSGVFGSLTKFARLPFIPVIGNGTSPFQPIHVADFACGIEKLVTSAHAEGEVFDVGGPDKVQLNALIDELIKRQGKKGIKIHIPVWLGLILAKIFAILPHPPITKSNVLGANEDLPMNTEPFFAAIGFVPRSLTQGLDEFFAKASQGTHREARLLLKYVSGQQPSDHLIKRYGEALYAQHIDNTHTISATIYALPFLLGPLETMTKIFYSHGTLQKKLLVAAALFECDPHSAEKLLPKKRSIIALIIHLGWNSVRVAIKAISGMFLFVIPGFIKRNA